ncbi:hypothetical protein [Pseudomonas iridis]|uniref:hypothetical protein n=1 Tax=Pseudomonas iridis TaxID=2710587 RepID=UPI001B33C97C|nr:hypothetical protein [Pseudomonas iridis]MBP5971056.1 hypothetical protein [Pseudomonas iridis]
MSVQTKPLLIVNDEASANAGGASIREARYREVATSIGAELLLLDGLSRAELITLPRAVTAEDEADDVVGRDWRGNPTYSEKARAAFRLVERLVNAGEVKLAPDRWVQGALRFQPPGASVVVEPLSVPCTLQSFAAPERQGLCAPSVVFGVVIGVILTGVVGAVLHLAGL